jgi:hypothetical protein
MHFFGFGLAVVDCYYGEPLKKYKPEEGKGKLVSSGWFKGEMLTRRQHIFTLGLTPSQVFPFPQEIVTGVRVTSHPMNLFNTFSQF